MCSRPYGSAFLGLSSKERYIELWLVIRIGLRFDNLDISKVTADVEGVKMIVTFFLRRLVFACMISLVIDPTFSVLAETKLCILVTHVIKIKHKMSLACVSARYSTRI